MSKQDNLVAFGKIMSVLGENSEMLSKNPQYARQIVDFVEKFECAEEKTCGDCDADVPQHDEKNECRRCDGIFCDGCLIPVEDDVYCRTCYQIWF